MKMFKKYKVSSLQYEVVISGDADYTENTMTQLRHRITIQQGRSKFIPIVNITQMSHNNYPGSLDHTATQATRSRKSLAWR